MPAPSPACDLTNPAHARFVGSWSRAVIPVALVVVLLFGAVGSSHAVDGVLEINQTCAVTTGCFSGDTAGFPVTINGSAGWSYRLTSDLNVLDPNTDGLYLTTSRITIDFNGFSLVGFSLNAGNANGVSGAGADGSFAGATTLKNGVIRGWPARGIALAGALNVRVEDMTLELNAAGGLALGDGAQVLTGRFVANGSTTFDGLVTGDRSLIKDNSVSESGGNGILAGDSCIVSGNVVTNSKGHGIRCEEGCRVSENVVYGSTFDGIRASLRATVSGNSVALNGGIGIYALASTVSVNTVQGNSGDGILADGAGSNVEGNTVFDNGGYGLRLSQFTAYRANVLGSNSGGTVDNGWDAGANVCNGSTTCP